MASIWFIWRRIESPVSKLLNAPPIQLAKYKLRLLTLLFTNRFYVLVATAVFARKLDWIKSAALSTALPLSASAAVHGIVLAALHRDSKN